MTAHYCWGLFFFLLKQKISKVQLEPKLHDYMIININDTLNTD